MPLKKYLKQCFSFVWCTYGYFFVDFDVRVESSLQLYIKIEVNIWLAACLFYHLACNLILEKENAASLEWYTSLQVVIKRGISRQSVIWSVGAFRSSGPQCIHTCVGFHSAGLKLARCCWCESENRRGDGSDKLKKKRRRKRRVTRVVRRVGIAFSGFYHVHQFPFDPAGDGFPCGGLWMSRDQR